MSSFGSLFSSLLPTLCARPNSHPCPSPFPKDRSSPLNPADTCTFPACLSLSPSGPPLMLPYLTRSSLSPPSFKPLDPASSPPPHCPSLPRETRHPFLLALNEPARMCDDYTSHPHHPSLTPTPTAHGLLTYQQWRWRWWLVGVGCGIFTSQGVLSIEECRIVVAEYLFALLLSLCLTLTYM
jgi:hypothetical protein